MLVEFHYTPGEGNRTHGIWLVDAKNPDRKRLLYEYNRSAAVLFSPDEKQLIVDDHAGSSEAMVYLFERVSGLEYRQSPLDLDKALWSRFFKQIGVRHDPSDGSAEAGFSLDHSYIYSEWWSGDSSAVLFSLNGHNGGYLWADNWHCVYDFKKKEVTLDLGVLNRGAVGGKDLEPPLAAAGVKSTGPTVALPASPPDL